MDTPVEVLEVVATDALGRRSGPRRLRSTEEKRQIVEATLRPGASVAPVAQAHGVNANLVFGWRKLYQKGLLEPNAATPTVPLLPVKVTAPTVVAKRGRLRNSRDVGPRFHGMPVQGIQAMSAGISRHVGPAFHGMSVQFVRQDNHGYRDLFPQGKEIVGGPNEVVRAQDSRGIAASSRRL